MCIRDSTRAVKQSLLTRDWFDFICCSVSSVYTPARMVAVVQRSFHMIVEVERYW